MKKCFLNLSVFLFAIFLVSGCRSGRYDLTKAQLRTDFQGVGRLAIGVQDQRPYVLNGEKPPTYIGLYHIGWGVPKNIDTRSGKTFAEDITAILSSFLKESGFQVTKFILSPNEKQEQAIKQLVPSEYDKIIVLTIDNFRSDSWVEVELQWEISIAVYDGKGKILTEKESVGFEERLKRNRITAVSSAQAQKTISDQLGKILVELINAPECQKAIGNNSELVKKKTAEKIANIEFLVNDEDKLGLLELAKSMYQAGENNQEVLDNISEIMWSKRSTIDRDEIQTLILFCQVLGSSDNARYRRILEIIKKEGKARKLRKYAIRSLNDLPEAGTLEQYEAGREKKLNAVKGIARDNDAKEDTEDDRLEPDELQKQANSTDEMSVTL